MNSESYEYSEPVASREHGSRIVGAIPLARWSAIFAGLFVTLAVSWLIQMFGLALGLTIADATDSATMGGTLSPAISIWTLVCWLVSFFLGALVAARLAGRIDDMTGMLYGFTVWSVGTIVMVVFAYYGLAAFVQTGARFAGNVAQGAGTAAQSLATGVSYTAGGVSSITQQVNQKYGDRIRDRLYDQAVEIASEGTEGVSEEEVRSAINDLDSRTLRRIVVDLSNDDAEGAAQLLSDATELSQEDAQSLIDAAYQSLEKQFGDPNNNQNLVQDLRSQLAKGLDSYIASLDSRGGIEVTEQDVRQALNQLDAESAQVIGTQLISGDVDAAKRTLTRKTDLSEAQVNELIDGASEGINEEIASYKEAVDKTVETISTYTASVMWLIFAGASAALAAALGGGYLGAESSRRLYPAEYAVRSGKPIH